MTATTPTYLLPYQVGTDAPCDAPDVWCALATLEDATLKRISDIRDRLVPAVPAATFTTEQETIVPPDARLTGGTAAIFDELISVVEFDTDNMINTDRTASRIVFRRPGIYLLMAWSQLQGGGVAGVQPYTLYLTRSDFGPSVALAGGSSGASAAAWVDDVLWTSGLAFPTFGARASFIATPSNPLLYPEDTVGIGYATSTTTTENFVVGPGRVSALWLRDL